MSSKFKDGLLSYSEFHVINIEHVPDISDKYCIVTKIIIIKKL